MRVSELRLGNTEVEITVEWEGRRFAKSLRSEDFRIVRGKKRESLLFVKLLLQEMG